MNAQNKVRKVMGEFGSGSLRSSSGQKVTNPKQAMAIALSEQRRVRGMKNGGMPSNSNPTPEERARLEEQIKEIRADELNKKGWDNYKKGKQEEARRNRRFSDSLNPLNWFGSNPNPSPLKSPQKTDPQDDINRAINKGDVGPRGYIRRAKGGNIKALINRQNTRHGKMDMPYHSLKRMTGKKAGGKVRLFEGGPSPENVNQTGEFDPGLAVPDIVSYNQSSDVKAVPSTLTFGQAFRDARNRAVLEERNPDKELFTWRGKSYRANMAKPKPKIVDYGDEVGRLQKRYPSPPPPPPPVAAKPDSANNKSKLATIMEAAAPEELTRNVVSAGLPMALGGAGINALARTPALVGALARNTGKTYQKARESMQAFRARRAARKANSKAERDYDLRRASDMEAGYFKGGGVKTYQKGGLAFGQAFRDARNRAVLEGRDPGKEEFTWRGKSYRANMAAPKAAAPKKVSDADFKAHELHGMGEESPQRNVVGEKEKAARKSDANFEAYEYNRAGGHIKKRNMGGNIKYVKGGGIEKRGKTRGAIVRMAAGGSVSARADGIAQRGKTRCKMV